MLHKKLDKTHVPCGSAQPCEGEQPSNGTPHS